MNAFTIFKGICFVNIWKVWEKPDLTDQEKEKAIRKFPGKHTWWGQFQVNLKTESYDLIKNQTNFFFDTNFQKSYFDKQLGKTACLYVTTTESIKPFQAVVSFYNPWGRQKTSGFQENVTLVIWVTTRQMTYRSNQEQQDSLLLIYKLSNCLSLMKE